MNALAHRVAGGTGRRAVRRLSMTFVTHPPRPVRMLTASLLCTTVSMAALARLASRIG